MAQIVLEAIGYLETPYKTLDEIPSQSVHVEGKRATIVLDAKYQAGLKDLDKNSHIVIQFYFHKSDTYKLQTKTPWGDDILGVFATRSPKRPNPIGITIVKLLSVKDNKVEIEGVDMLDGTPVLDIKPYAPGLNPK